MENHWNLDRKNVYGTDIFYVLVYCVAYVVIAFVFPFFMVASRNKFIIDSLQKLQQEPLLLVKGEGFACMALVVAITCNVHLASVTIKMALLSFYIFDFLIGYIVSAAVFFQYLNVLGNFLLITRSSVHFFILVLFNWNVRYVVAMDLYIMKKAFIRFLLRWKKPVAVIEASVEVHDVIGCEV